MVSYFTPILLIKLHHHLLLLSGFNGPSAYASDLINGIDSGDLPALHQVTGEHRPRPPKTMQTVAPQQPVKDKHFSTDMLKELHCVRLAI